MANAKALGRSLSGVLEVEQDQGNRSGAKGKESSSCVQRAQSRRQVIQGPQDERVTEILEQNLTCTL